MAFAAVLGSAVLGSLAFAAVAACTGTDSRAGGSCGSIGDHTASNGLAERASDADFAAPETAPVLG